MGAFPFEKPETFVIICSMNPEHCVTCKVSFGEESKTFTIDTAGECDEKAKAVEVTTEHEEGPLKVLLSQLESVQVQTNHHLTQIISQLNPNAKSEEDKP